MSDRKFLIITFALTCFGLVTSFFMFKSEGFHFYGNSILVITLFPIIFLTSCYKAKKELGQEGKLKKKTRENLIGVVVANTILITGSAAVFYWDKVWPDSQPASSSGLTRGSSAAYATLNSSLRWNDNLMKEAA